jgi:hypothetical protein
MAKKSRERKLRSKVTRIPDRIRSKERLVFAFHEKDSLTGVKRATVRRFASQLNMSETRFLHLGAASLVKKLTEQSGRASDRRSNDDARVTDEQISALRAMFPQDRVATASFLDLLNEPD